MNYFAICELTNGEYECIRVYRENVAIKYKEIVNNTIKQLEKDNETRKEDYKIIKFVDLVQHGNGFGAHAHFKWSQECCENAKLATYPIYDFVTNELNYY